VDGVHLDYVRYPSEEFDYSRESLLAFQKHLAGMLSEAELKRHEHAIGGDLVAWTEAFPERWDAFRRERLTALVSRVRDSVKVRMVVGAEDRLLPRNEQMHKLLNELKIPHEYQVVEKVGHSIGALFDPAGLRSFQFTAEAWAADHAEFFKALALPAGYGNPTWAPGRLCGPITFEGLE
jgi:acetyl esterase/lipase